MKGDLDTDPLDVAVHALHAEVERFLYREARLLDAGDYEAWLALLAPEIHYWMPVIENRMRADPKGAYGADRLAYFDDRMPDIVRRIARYRAPTAWSEDPPTRHVHVVSNVEVEAAPQAGQVIAHSVFINYRNRGARDEEVIYGRRRDLLRRDTGTWLLAQRQVLIAQNVLLAKNINTFL